MQEKDKLDIIITTKEEKEIIKIVIQDYLFCVTDKKIKSVLSEETIVKLKNIYLNKLVDYIKN